MICRNFRRKIESLGGEYRFGCRFEGLDIADGQIRGIRTSSGYIADACRDPGNRAQRPRHVPDAATTRAFRCRQRRFSWDFGSSIRRNRSIMQKYGRPEYVELAGSGRLFAESPAAAATSSRFACAPAER